jgi:hypothetical protein
VHAKAANIENAEDGSTSESDEETTELRPPISNNNVRDNKECDADPKGRY